MKNMGYLAFWAWLISLNTMISSPIHFSANDMISFFIMAEVSEFLAAPITFPTQEVSHFTENFRNVRGLIRSKYTSCQFLNLLYKAEKCSWWIYLDITTEGKKEMTLGWKLCFQRHWLHLMGKKFLRSQEMEIAPKKAKT
jgi:hypothetical protein